MLQMITTFGFECNKLLGPKTWKPLILPPCIVTEQHCPQQWPSHTWPGAKQVSKKVEEAVIIRNNFTYVLLPPDLISVLCIASDSHFTLTQYIGWFLWAADHRATELCKNPSSQLMKTKVSSSSDYREILKNADTWSLSTSGFYSAVGGPEHHSSVPQCLLCRCRP